MGAPDACPEVATAQSSLPLVHLIWLDAYRSESELGLNEARTLTPVQVQEVGWLLVDAKTHVVLGTGRIEDPGGALSFRWTVAIPRSLVVSMRRIRSGNAA